MFTTNLNFPKAWDDPPRDPTWKRHPVISRRWWRFIDPRTFEAFRLDLRTTTGARGLVVVGQVVVGRCRGLVVDSWPGTATPPLVAMFFQDFSDLFDMRRFCSRVDGCYLFWVKGFNLWEAERFCLVVLVIFCIYFKKVNHHFEPPFGGMMIIVTFFFQPPNKQIWDNWKR